eukprot:Pgem_evm1s12025
MLKITFLCNWCTSENLIKYWSKFFKGKDFLITPFNYDYYDCYDYYVVINSSTYLEHLPLDKVIYFCMEPNYPVPDNSHLFFRFFNHAYPNLMEWHLDYSCWELQNRNFQSNKKIQNHNHTLPILSTILSNKTTDQGHKLRIELAKMMDSDDYLQIHVFGNVQDIYNFKIPKRKELPYHDKSAGLLPYKYHFNCENNFINNYTTEKLYDGIMAECLVFYGGPVNIVDWLDPRAYVLLDMQDLQSSLQKIKTCIKNNEYEKRWPYILKAKKYLLTHCTIEDRLNNALDGRIC